MFTSPEFIIEVKQLTKRFGALVAVDGIDLSVKKGEIFGFLGPNGSGKTTTIRMICGLLTPDSGEGHCLGYDIMQESQKIKQYVGYMTQKFSLYEDLSIIENLDFSARMYAIENRQQRVKESLDQLGISQKRQRQLAGQLSGGWKQRLALAAATLHQPQLLLLDEPTAGVDPKARREFWDHIHYLAAQGTTTFVSTHYMDEAERCTRLAYILYGKMRIQGDLETVIARSNLSTWSVQGRHLDVLAAQLKTHPAVDQITNFGLNLHISSTNSQNLADLAARYQSANYQWTQLTPSLEDVFIKLVDEK